MFDRSQNAYGAANPANRMIGKAGGDDSADHRIAYRDDRGFNPVEVDRGIQAQVQGYKEKAERC
jgi:hypothetical protein